MRQRNLKENCTCFLLLTTDKNCKRARGSKSSKDMMQFDDTSNVCKLLKDSNPTR